MKKLTLLLLVSLCGCAKHARPYLVDVIVPRQSLLSDPVLLQCDMRVNPPKCKSIKLVYKNGFEQIKAK